MVVVDVVIGQGQDQRDSVKPHHLETPFISPLNPTPRIGSRPENRRKIFQRSSGGRLVENPERGPGRLASSQDRPGGVRRGIYRPIDCVAVWRLALLVQHRATRQRTSERMCTKIRCLSFHCERPFRSTIRHKSIHANDLRKFGESFDFPRPRCRIKWRDEKGLTERTRGPTRKPGVRQTPRSVGDKSGDQWSRYNTGSPTKSKAGSEQKVNGSLKRGGKVDDKRPGAGATEYTGERPNHPSALARLRPGLRRVARRTQVSNPSPAPPRWPRGAAQRSRDRARPRT